MFNLEKEINKWLRLFRKHREFNHGSIREMELHLRDHIYDLVAKGSSQEEAFHCAVKQFGDIKPLAKEEHWNQKPKSIFNSSHNTAMVSNYFKIATRNFVNQKFYSFLNIVGLTLGLAIVFIIGLFVIDELSFDRFHAKKNQLYRVVENQYYSDQPVFPVAVTPTSLAPALKSGFPEVVNTTRASRDNYRFEQGDKQIVELDGIMVDDSFFDMFSFPLSQGSLESFSQNPNGLILNKELATKYFPEEDPIGKMIKLDGEEFIVSGILEEIPRTSHLDFRYVMNFQHYLTNNPDRAVSWGSNWLYTYAELEKSADYTAVNEKIIGLIKANNDGSVSDIYLQPLTDIYLGTVDFTVEVSRKGQMIYVKVFAIVAVFILLISCINFMNLSTARSAKRSKEVGLRKTVGALRGQLIFQFLSESILYTLVAVLLAVGIVAIILPSFNALTNKGFTLAALLDPALGVKLTIGIIGVALLTGLMAGSYPAIVLSATKPISSLNGKTEKGKGGVFFRQALVVTQFTISVVLIIGTVVVYQQLQYIQQVDLGYNKENIIYTRAPEEKVVTFANEVRQQKGVINAGLSNRHPAYVLSSSSGFSWPGSNPEETILVHFMGIDEHYMSTMGMELVDGRQFVQSDSAVVYINQKALAVMGLKAPIGQVITAYGEQTIVGVVKDFNFKSIHSEVEPIIIFKLPNPSRVYIKYEAGQEEQIVKNLENVWAKVYPDREFDYYFLEDDFNELYQAEQRTSTLSTIFAGLAIIISCLGLFGLVSYATEQRSKEVGIRKVLGASVNNLFLLLTGDFTKLVFISLFISIPIGWFAMNQWLESFAYRTHLSVWIFVLSGMAALLIAVVTVSYQTIRASLSNPAKALKSE